MSEDQETINDGIGEPSQPVTAQSGDLISTVDMAMPTPEEKPSEEAKKTEEPDGGDKGKGEDKKTEEELKAEEQKAADLKAVETAKAEESAKADEVRFDKHPRFQELISGNRAMKAQIAEQAEQLKTLQEPPKEKALKYIDMGELSNDKLTEMFEENPQTFVRNMAQQLNAEIRVDVLSEVQESMKADKEAVERKSIEVTYNKYAQDHSDFDQMWDTGKLQTYMDENPGHNAISAHMALTQEAEQQKKTDTAVAEAVKDAEAKAVKNVKAKKKAQVLGSGPSSGGKAVNQIPVELKDTKKYGGLAKVLAARSQDRTNRQVAP